MTTTDPRPHPLPLQMTPQLRPVLTPRSLAGVVWACPVCELSAGPFGSRREAVQLAARHDALCHRGRPTVEVSDAGLCESCRHAPATVTWSRPQAGAPFALCADCHPGPTSRTRTRSRARTRAQGTARSGSSRTSTTVPSICAVPHQVDGGRVRG